METQGYSPKDKLPVENKVVCFDVKGELFEGTFNQEENLFFIGFGNSVDFKYTFEVDYWFYKSGSVNPKICIKKCGRFPNCEPCGTWFSKM